MLYILIFGVVMAALSAVFWVLEAKPFFDKVKRLTQPKSTNPVILAAQSAQYLAGFIGATLSLWRLVLDIICTVWLAGAFGFSGMIGGVLGVTISNVISIFLLSQGRNTNRSPSPAC